MSAVLESPVAAASAALEAVQAELTQLDIRIRGYEQELEEIDFQKQQHRVAVITAVSANQPLPKPLKSKTSDADVALPILKGKRPALVERVADAEGKLRRACVQEVERRYQQAQGTFAQAARTLTDSWAELIGAHMLLERAGVKTHPLPPTLFNDFSIPAFGKLRPIADNHWAHFVAGHALDQGAGTRATGAVRQEIEGRLGMVLPW